MRIDGFVALIGLLDTREGVNADLIEADFIPYILLRCLTWSILVVHLNMIHVMLSHYLLDTALEEAVEGRDLL